MMRLGAKPTSKRTLVIQRPFFMEQDFRVCGRSYALPQTFMRKEKKGRLAPHGQAVTCHHPLSSLPSISVCRENRAVTKK